MALHSVHDQQGQINPNLKASIASANTAGFRPNLSPRDVVATTVGARSPRKVRLIPEAEYAHRQNSGGHQTSKSVASLTRTDSDRSNSKATDHTVQTAASTSFYTATATTYTAVSSPHHRSDDAAAPCDGDPFWDYYRTIGNISRANSYELMNVMKFISADHIINFFLQSWLQARIAPTELPYANEAIMSKMKYSKRRRVRRERPRKGAQKQRSKALRSLTMSAAPKMERIESERHDQFDHPVDRADGHDFARHFTMNESGGHQFDALRMCSSPNAPRDRDREDGDLSDDEEDAFSSAHGDIFNGCASRPRAHRGGTSNGRKFNINSINSSVSSMSTVHTQSTMTVPRYRATAPDSVIYSTKSTNSKMDLSLNHSSLTKFIQQSLSVCDEAAKHPNAFHIPRLTKMQRNLREKAIVFMQQDANRRYRHRAELVDFMHFDEAHRFRDKGHDEMNRIGSTILSFCEQSSFLSASLVSRSWFYCSRCEASRSQIRLRLYNVLRHLTKHRELLAVICKQNGILSVDEMIRKYQIDSIRNVEKRYDADSDSDDSDLHLGGDRDELEAEHLRQRDLFIACVSGSNDQESSAEFIGNLLLRESSTLKGEGDLNGVECEASGSSKAFHFPHFFSTRTQCSLFSSVTVLQLDLTILSNNGLMYFVDQRLCDCYWEMAFSLFRIESLQSIDVVLPDPHVVLLSYMLTNIDRISVRKSELKFPSIGIPKNKFLCISKVLRSLSFKCKSLSTAKLLRMLDTHFEHYFHRSHHPKAMMEQCDRDHAHFVHVVRHQASALYFKSLDSYQLCRKAIQKPLLYDITHALYYLNRRPCDEVQSVETLVLSDVRCASKELQTFLNHNANALSTVEITFTESGVLRPVSSSLHGRGYSNLSKTKRGSNHGTPSAQSSGSGKSGHSGHSGSGCSGSAGHYRCDSTIHDEDTGFPDVAVMHQHSKRPKSSTQKRIIQNINEILDAVVRYLTVSTAKLKDYNDRIRAQRLHEERLALPLESLALSFPATEFGEEGISGVFEICKVLEASPDEVRLRSLYLSGCMLSRSNLRKVNWGQMLQCQQFERLYLHRMVFAESFFESACKSWSHSLVHLELSLRFDADPRTTPISRSSTNRKGHKAIKRLFLLLEKCHKLEVLSLDFAQRAGAPSQWMAQCSPLQHSQSGYDSRSSSSAQRRRSSIFGGSALPQLPQSLPQVDHSPSLSAVSGGHDSGCSPSSSASGDYHLMEPVLDIWWIHKFMVSQNTKRSLRSLRLTFNELSTARFESHRHGASSSSKFVRFNQAHGQILRISESFAREVEALIMSWFSKCDALRDATLTRRFSTMDSIDAAFNRTPYSTTAAPRGDTTEDDRAVHFDRDISVFAGSAKEDAMASAFGIDHDRDGELDVARFVVKKWRVGHVFKGDVEGDLARLMMPEIPIG